MTRSRKFGVFLSAGLMATLPTIASAGAQVSLACGQTITQSTTLTADIGPCPNNGLIVGADNITLSLGRFRIFGTPNAGDGAGVLLQGRTGVTVRFGTVSDFDGGVVILGGSANTVTSINARNNIGAAQGQPGATSSLYGDGILIQGSTRNQIIGNNAENNGPFSGIAVIRGDSDHPGIPPADAPFNVIRSNSVNYNVACRRSGTCDNDGIRIEPAVTDTQITGNSVAGNGLDGIALFGTTTRNVVTGNTTPGNGFRGAVRGDGIRVFGFGNVISSNSANGNAASGISIGRRVVTGPGSFPVPNGRNNVVTSNAAFGNGINDLWDSNPLCDNNVWHGNQGITAVPDCTKTP